MIGWPTHLKLWMSCSPTVLQPHVRTCGLGEWEQVFEAFVTLVNVSHLCVWHNTSCVAAVLFLCVSKTIRNWLGLLVCHHSCSAGVKQMYTCTLASHCIYIKELKLAFCSCHPPTTFTRPCKIPCVMLPILLFWGFRYGSLCASTSLLWSRLCGLGVNLVTASAVLQNPSFRTSVSLEHMLTSQCTACFNVASSQNE